jgi:hypothetical protein
MVASIVGVARFLALGLTSGIGIAAGGGGLVGATSA